MEESIQVSLPDEFKSGNQIEVERATIRRERMEEILRKAIAADRVARGEVVLTWDPEEKQILMVSRQNEDCEVLSVLGVAGKGPVVAGASRAQVNEAVGRMRAAVEAEKRLEDDRLARALQDARAITPPGLAQGFAQDLETQRACAAGDQA